jgi:hypothetical protein
MAKTEDIRRDDILRRMLNTPHTPHVKKKTSKKKAARKAAAKKP